MTSQPEHVGRAGSGDTTVQGGGKQAARDAELALVLLLGRVADGRARFVLGTEPVRVGRHAEGNHVHLIDPRSSRRHAEIYWSEIHRQHWVRDLGSSNGIHLNGNKVSRELLKPGDVIRIGDTFFRITPAESEAPWATSATSVVGASRSLRMTFAQARSVAGSGAPVLILGATGTGKELVAREIHAASGRTGPLVVINCAALPGQLVESELFGHEKGAFSGADAPRPGLFRLSHGGTLFLDEVGELAADVQAKLLRAIDARSIRPVGAGAEVAVDVRIVAATNRALIDDVQRGGFRADLYARLSESVIRIDPLCERPEDLAPLWRHFVAELGGGVTLEPGGDAFEAMLLHAWPFNVRELRQLARSALLRKPTGGELALDDLPEAMRAPRAEAPVATDPACSPGPAAALVAPGEVPTRQQLLRLVEEFHGNVQDMARYLHKDRKQVYRWLQREHIDPGAYRL